MSTHQGKVEVGKNRGFESHTSIIFIRQFPTALWIDHMKQVVPKVLQVLLGYSSSTNPSRVPELLFAVEKPTDSRLHFLLTGRSQAVPGNKLSSIDSTPRELTSGMMYTATCHSPKLSRMATMWLRVGVQSTRELG